MIECQEYLTIFLNFLPVHANERENVVLTDIFLYSLKDLNPFIIPIDKPTVLLWKSTAYT